MSEDLFIAYVILASLVFGVAWWWEPKRAQRRRRLIRAKQHLAVLATIDCPARKFRYLKNRVNPFVFEEMIVESFRRRGFTVKRPKYQADGGIDGQVKIGGRWALIQAKRYRNHIRKEHVEAFSALCASRRLLGIVTLRRARRGFFIHCGKTGKESRELAQACPNVEIVSGKKLLNLFHV